MYFIVLWTLVKLARTADSIRPSAAAEKKNIDRQSRFLGVDCLHNEFPRTTPIDIKNQIKVIRLSELPQSTFQLKRGDLIERYHKAGKMILSFSREISGKKKKKSFLIGQTYAAQKMWKM